MRLAELASAMRELLFLGVMSLLACGPAGGPDGGTGGGGSAGTGGGSGGGAANATCNNVNGGCQCTGKVSSVDTCNQGTAPGTLTCCQSSDGSCECLQRAYTGPWTCGTGGPGNDCTCFPSASAMGSTVSTCTAPQCVWNPSGWCECDEIGGSESPSSKPVSSCTNPPGLGVIAGSCPAGTTAVFACDGTEPPSCDPSVCDDSFSVEGVSCYHDCETPGGAISSGVGTSCVQHCN